MNQIILIGKASDLIYRQKINQSEKNGKWMNGLNLLKL